MDVLIVIGAMVAVGVVIGAIAGPIWKGVRPRGVRTDFLAAILTAVVIGLIDWYVVPAMGFSDTLKYAALATEPALAALLVLWLLRRASA